MSSSKTLMATAALSLLAGVNGHCLISQPVPFDQSALNNSPLAADGSDYPCKVGSGSGYGYTITQMNNITVGEANTLEIIGGATHGGGSCQVSVTLDQKPNKNSQWKVIHSIVGGCPNPLPGNAADVATFDGNPKFSYTLPKGMPNGQYTLAWSWLNHVGNREFYMNCAPISVSGGADNNDVLSTLPDMFVANIPPTSCATEEGEDFAYPDPGDSVETGSSAKPGTAFSISAGCASVTKLGAGAGKLGSPAQATGAAGGSDSGSSSAAGSSAGGGMIGVSATAGGAPAASATASSGGNPGGVFAPGASSAATTMATSVAPVPAATSAPAATDSSSAAAPAASGSSGSDGSSGSSGSSGSTGSSGAPEAGAVACTASGFYCIDANTFGMCANGYAVPQAVAAGTSCTSNKIDFASKQVAPGTQKKRESSKYARYFRSHAHMHRRHALGYDF